MRARVGEVRGEDTRCYIDRDPDARVTWSWYRLEPCSWVEGGTTGSLVRTRCARLERWLEVVNARQGLHRITCGVQESNISLCSTEEIGRYNFNMNMKG